MIPIILIVFCLVNPQYFPSTMWKQRWWVFPYDNLTFSVWKATIYSDMIWYCQRNVNLCYKRVIVYFLPCTDHFTAKLSVRKSKGPEFVSTNFTFFDCNTYSSCTECVSSPFPCDWCVDGHRCTHDSAENCRNDVLVNGVNVSLMESTRVRFTFKNSHVLVIDCDWYS